MKTGRAEEAEIPNLTPTGLTVTLIVWSTFSHPAEKRWSFLFFCFGVQPFHQGPPFMCLCTTLSEPHAASCLRSGSRSKYKCVPDDYFNIMFHVHFVCLHDCDSQGTG